MPIPFTQFIAPARHGSAFWRFCLGLCVVFAVYSMLNLAGAYIYVLVTGQPPEMSLPGKTPIGVLLLLMSFLPLIIGLIVAVQIVHRRDGWSLLGAMWQLDFLRATALLGLLYFVGFMTSEFSGTPTAPNLPIGIWAAFLPLGIAATLCQTLAEELLFRGYLLQQLAVRFAARWVWFALPSLLFGVAHAQPDQFGDAWMFPVIAATLFGFVAADLTVRRGNLGMAWGLHFATNFFALSVVATGPSMTGLSLRLAPHSMLTRSENPWMFLADLTPLLLAWAILRRNHDA